MIPSTMRQIRTLVTHDGQLELSIAMVDTPVPGPNEVLVRIEAAPINPSDLGLLLAAADVSRATSSGPAGSPIVTAPIPAAAMARLGARVGESMAVGNEGSGTVVAAGDSPEAQALIGHMVAIAAGGSYSEYRAVPTMLCMDLPDGTSAAAGASCFVNPLTALGMVETMRMEQHTALVHTAAASNLGQMLQRVCLADGVPLVNIVRRSEQVAILRGLGAAYVCDSSEPTFVDDLTAALIATGATLTFDATGGGTLAGQILSCMETAANAAAGGYSRYGSTVHKQAYIYGSLDRSPTELSRDFGMSWGVGGWLLTPFLGRLGLEGMLRLRQRVVDELETTFASHYTDEVSLSGALDLGAIRTYARQATGQKFLIRPTLG
ncbi:MAG: oxidase [Ilumatobacteraceae bacterium]|nr:oxidase [Ilumatobacteraceae bacterium]